MLRHQRQRGSARARESGGQDRLPVTPAWRSFARRREGICFALDGGVWFHRYRLRGEPMAHLVSADREALLAVGRRLELHPAWLQYKPLKDPRSGVRVKAWHWDMWGTRLERLEQLTVP